MSWWNEGLREAPFIAQGGWFPQKVIRKQYLPRLGLSRHYSLPKCTWTGAHLGRPWGSAVPQVAPPQLCLPWLADRWVLTLSRVHLLWCARFLWFVGPSCKCNEGCLIFCVFSCVLRTLLGVYARGCLHNMSHRNLWKLLELNPLSLVLVIYSMLSDADNGSWFCT